MGRRKINTRSRGGKKKKKKEEKDTRSCILFFGKSLL